MKHNIRLIFIILQFIFLLISCTFDSLGRLFITNGYEYTVKAHIFYDYNTIIVDEFEEFRPRLSYPVAARTNYDKIIAIQIETKDGTVLANYTPEYLMLLRKAHKKKENAGERWVFTEKGLFLKTNEIARRYKHDDEKILTYFRSDEAVQDLQERLYALNTPQ